MNLADLQSARSKERQKDSLQHLRDDFYADVGAFVEELRTERGRAAEASDDPFDAPEVRRLTDDIKTAENTVEAIYERRVGKLVKLASLEAAGMPADEGGLTAEERDLFRTLVDAIESNRTHVLDDVLSGGRADRSSNPTASAVGERTTDTPDDALSTADSSDAAPADVPDTSDDAADSETTDGRPDREEGVSAADVMGADAADEPSTPAHESPTDADPQTGTDGGTDDRPAPAEPDDARGRTPAGVEDVGGETVTQTTPDGDAAADTDRTTVRITRDVGEILGVDERTYHLAAEDVVTLPDVNATPLLERDAAERLG